MLTIETVESPTMLTAVDQGLPPAPWGLPSRPSSQAYLHTRQSFKSVRKRTKFRVTVLRAWPPSGSKWGLWVVCL